MRYDVPLLNQSVSPICYVVCAAMIQKYMQQSAGHSFNTSQLTGGFDPVQSCIAAAAVPGFYKQRLERAGFALIQRPGKALDRQRLHLLLVQKGPLICNHFVANFNYGKKRGGKQPAGAPGIHAIVITGLSGDQATFNNPWGDKDVPIPLADLLASIHQSYSHPYHALFYAVASPEEQNILD